MMLHVQVLKGKREAQLSPRKPPQCCGVPPLASFSDGFLGSPQMTREACALWMLWLEKGVY